MTKDFSSAGLPSVEDLIFAIVQKNETAFSCLYDAYSAPLFGVIKKVAGHSAAEDILHNVFLNIWTHANLYNSNKERVFTWMLGIANNETKDYLHNAVAENKSLPEPLLPA